MTVIEKHAETLKGLYYLGVDVQIKRPCTFYVLDQDLAYVTSGLLGGADPDAITQLLFSLVMHLQAQGPGGVAVGIDAPRRALPAPRQWYWRKGAWGARTSGEKGYGRHCEVVIKSMGLGNPQWTRLEGDSPPWMALGYRLFESLSGLAEVFEVFPSASYHMLRDTAHPPIALCLKGFARRAKDMLDACSAAYTAWAFLNGRGTQVGGGDGLGTIVLPEKLPVSATHPVLHWPD